ncbi:unnamed protein product [Lepeophtheirus salmonis]|uniref:(salmon louse) hypothetical protein n=1 Tax=Lepeophtheirus salmonis TaxID=72036 RepID=A0A7R8CU06_LEPSM|nr:unnamed protein product [Lepeophtheirus salmonis]CAF2931327.1 unnamed protein product [Lepeophtheirus salmonis]
MDILDTIIKESKGGGILRSPLSKNSSRVHFEAPSNLKDILSKYSNSEECLEEIQGLMTHAQNLQGAALITWIEELQESIPLLNKKLEGFVKALFKISWVTQEAPVADAFKVFLINLLSAHSFYITDIVQSLVSNFLIKNDQISHNTHEVLKVVILTCPLDGKRALLQSLSDNIPYIMTPACDTHTSYFDNLLKLLRYAKDIRLDILRLIIQRAVELDVRLPKISLEEEK